MKKKKLLEVCFTSVGWFSYEQQISLLENFFVIEFESDAELKMSRHLHTIFRAIVKFFSSFN